MNRFGLSAALAVVALFASACSGGLPPEVLASVDGPVNTAATNDKAGIPTETIDALNEAVPIGNVLVFEPRVLIDSDEPEFVIVAAIPIGWTQRSEKIVSAPYFSADIVGSPQIAIEAGCQGFCSAQDWAELMASPDSSIFASTKSEGTIVDSYDLVDGRGRAEIFQPSDSDRLKITVTRWDDAAAKFLWCRAEVGTDNAGLAPLLADACAAATPGWFD